MHANLDNNELFELMESDINDQEDGDDQELVTPVKASNAKTGDTVWVIQDLLKTYTCVTMPWEAVLVRDELNCTKVHLPGRPGVHEVIESSFVFDTRAEALAQYATHLIAGDTRRILSTEKELMLIRKELDAINTDGNARYEFKNVHTFIDELDHDDSPELGAANYARWWFYNFLLPAYMRMQFEPFMVEHKLYCTYKGVRYRCIGASRLGDVWLTTKMDRAMGYEKRVNPYDCTLWFELH